MPPQRRSIRLRGFDYANPGAYFITVCTHRRECLFGRIVNDEMTLSPVGELIVQTWQGIPRHHPYVGLDVFVVMPNHVHGILVLAESVGAKHASPLHPSKGGTAPRSLSAVVQAFKSAATHAARQAGHRREGRLWQRGYHDRVIRDEGELIRVRAYMGENPLRWALDQENPGRGAG